MPRLSTARLTDRQLAKGGLVTSAEAAKELRCSVRTIDRLRTTGQLAWTMSPGGGRVLVYRLALEALKSARPVRRDKVSA